MSLIIDGETTIDLKTASADQIMITLETRAKDNKAAQRISWCDHIV